jgi:hypothetical protein
MPGSRLSANRDPLVLVQFSAIFTSSSKKCLMALDMAEQDVITPLAPGEKPGGLQRKTGRRRKTAEMPG